MPWQYKNVKYPEYKQSLGHYNIKESTDGWHQKTGTHKKWEDKSIKKANIQKLNKLFLDLLCTGESESVRTNADESLGNNQSPLTDAWLTDSLKALQIL